MLIAPSTLGATGLVAAEGKHADYGGGPVYVGIWGLGFSVLGFRVLGFRV